VCTGTFKGAGQSGIGGTFTGVVQGSQVWRVDVTGADPQVGAMVYLQTTLGFESIPCPAPTPAPTSTTGRPAGGASSNAALVCAGSTMGNGVQQGTAVVFANNVLAAQGNVKGPGPNTPTPTLTAAPTTTTPPTVTVPPTGTPPPTSTAQPTSTPPPPTPTAGRAPTLVPTVPPSPTPRPTATAVRTSTPVPTPAAARPGAAARSISR
jgi:hypothetical protein